MGNRRHNRFKRQEKSKVKLKAKKLSKAQNVTDTSFKVRKIIVPKQLKSLDDDAIVTRKKQNVKELLSRLNHHNESMKKSSLEGLKELLTNFPEEVLSLHLAELIEGVAQLILDEERAIRRDAVKILGLILAQVPDSKFQPFFNILISYLSCGMTHIHVSIQDDALLMLDALLTSAPSLVASNSHKLLTNFLNMISSQKVDSRPDRTLTVNLGTNFTTVKWRIKVLHRLHELLTAMLEYKCKPGTPVSENGRSNGLKYGNETHRWNSDKELNIPIHSLLYRQICYLPGIFGISHQGDGAYSDGNDLKNYVKVIMPLLIETWLEVRPDRMAYNIGRGSLLSLEAALLLRCILNIIRLLFELMELWNLKTEVPEVIAIYKKDFLQYFFPGFPYSYVGNVWEKKEKKSKSKKSGEDYMDMDKSCQDQNVAISLLFCRFYDERAEVEDTIRVLKYLEKCMKKWKKQNNKKDLIVILRHMIEKCSGSLKQQGIDIGSLLNSAIVCYMTTRDVFILELLSEIALKDICSHLQRNNNLQSWLECLPNLLCSSSISVNEVRILRKLACQNNPFFYASLCQKLPDILNNLGSISVTGAKDITEGRKEIVNILYWIKDWSEVAMKTLSKHLQCEHWDKELAVEILNVLTIGNLVNDSLKEFVGPTRV